MSSNTYYGVEDGGVAPGHALPAILSTTWGLTPYGGYPLGIEGNNFGANGVVTNEFKNPTTKFYMSAVDFEEGLLEPWLWFALRVSKNVKAPAPLSLTVVRHR
jgi:hypothetical protein